MNVVAAKDYINNCDFSREEFKPILDFAHVTFACEHQNAYVLAAVVKRQNAGWRFFL